jgi:hypothetical protein
MYVHVARQDVNGCARPDFKSEMAFVKNVPTSVIPKAAGCPQRWYCIIVSQHHSFSIVNTSPVAVE